MSSGGCLFCVAIPGRRLIVGAPMGEAAVEDADEAVREHAQRLSVGLAGGALLLVEAPRAGRCAERGEGPPGARVAEAVVADEPGDDDLGLSRGSGDG